MESSPESSPESSSPLPPPAASANLQIVVDCADPHAVADFWAAALGYTVEQDENFVRHALAAEMATDDDVFERHGVLVWKDAAAMSDPAGRRSRWYFQRVPEPKRVKNRMHIDIHAGTESRAAVVQHLLGLGANRLYEGAQGPYTWVTMADIEGNEFCVS